MPRPEFNYCPLCGTPLVRGRHGGRDRAACPAEGCGFVHWDNPVPVVAAVVEREGRVVLVRSNGWPETWYGLVTGFLESNEKPEDAVLREVDEELGIGGTLESYIGAYPFERMNQIIFVYHVLAAPGPIRLCREELADHKEVRIDRLRPWPRGTGPALRDWLASRGLHPPTVEFGTPIETE
ncbi:MAG TPA: NUDIX hydrolase [Gammaproteobacteria bacterium]|nr:NUDIX hydrolase [Gammaproteobacteria bacterium]